MKITQLNVPFLGANDDRCVLIEWLLPTGEKVEIGQAVCVIETTKTSLEVHAETSGLLYHLAEAGDQLEIHAPLALLSSTPLEDPLSVLKEEQAAESKISNVPSITKKAEMLAKSLGIKLSNLAEFFPEVSKISKEHIDSYLIAHQTSKLKEDCRRPQRIGMIGGASGGGALILTDSLLRCPDAQPTAIFDRDETLKGSHVAGIEVVGPWTNVPSWLDQGKIDAVVIAFNTNLDEREEVYEKLTSAGVPFTNVIDSTANIRSFVKIGSGNVILGDCYIGAGTIIENNNFLSAGTHIEHDNRIGSHCGFGPNVVTSGNVTIGNQVRFGAGIAVEPRLTINDSSIISSGSTITRDVPASNVININYNQKHLPIKSRPIK